MRAHVSTRMQSVAGHRVHVSTHRWTAGHLIECRRTHGGAQLRVMRYGGHGRHGVLIVHVVVIGVARVAVTLRWVTRCTGRRGIAGHLVMVGGGGSLHATIAAHQVGNRSDGSGTPDRTVGHVGTAREGKEG